MRCFFLQVARGHKKVPKRPYLGKTDKPKCLFDLLKAFRYISENSSPKTVRVQSSPSHSCPAYSSTLKGGSQSSRGYIASVRRQ